MPAGLPQATQGGSLEGMKAMTFDQELLEDIAEFIKEGDITIEGASCQYFTALNDLYPTICARIDWSKIPGAIRREAGRDTYVQDCIRFLERMREKYLLSGECVVIGDGAINVAISGPIETLAPVLERVLAYPQHHYIVPRDYSWLMAFTFEGDMFLGFLPAKKP